MGTDKFDAATREHILSQIQRELDAEVLTQNSQEAFSGDYDMREIKGLAQTMREAVASLKAKAASSAAEFQAEVAHSNVNFDKIGSVTQELKDANKEIEQMLGESGSNFSQSTVDTLGKADSNGVRVNQVK